MKTAFVCFFPVIPTNMGSAEVVRSLFLCWPGKKKLFQITHLNNKKKSYLKSFKIIKEKPLFKIIMIPFLIYSVFKFLKDTKNKLVIIEGPSWIGYSFLTLFMIVTFFSLSGHLVVFSLIYDSFSVIPIGTFADYSRLPEIGLESAELMLKTAAILMFPIVSVMLLINVSVGFITKSAPTLNLFSFGFPMTILGAFFILYFSVDALAFGFQDLARSILELLSSLLSVETNGR